MQLDNCKNQWALVTGASSGIGLEFCEQLAALGMNLVMVARREDLLKKIQVELEKKFGIQAILCLVDLSKPNAAVTVKQYTASKNIKIRLLCNNAAFGKWGKFESTSPESYEEMIQLNTSAMVSLCHHYLPDLTSFQTSGIINVSSPAALQPVPYMAVYAASKAFVHSFSQALYGEWVARGVHVQTLVPGPTATDFDAKAGAYESALKGRGTPKEVVIAALNHLATDNPLVTTAKGTYKQRIFNALFPAKMVINTVARMFRPPSKST